MSECNKCFPWRCDCELNYKSNQDRQETCNHNFQYYRTDWYYEIWRCRYCGKLSYH